MRAPTHHLNLPFFTSAHQTLAADLATWAAQQTAAVATDDKIAAFALSEPEAGSDADAMLTVANYLYRTWGNGKNYHLYSESVTLNGTKTWISNGTAPGPEAQAYTAG